MTDPKIVETTFYVRYAETDQMGIVHHSHYVVWMEEGRSEYMRRNDLDYVAIEQSGLSLAVTEVNVRYLAPAHYNERVTVRTRVDSLRSRALTFGYEIINADTRQRLVVGSVKLMLVDRQGQVVSLLRSFETLLKNARG
jgi:acyl-CoA thioester hydrolase